jgi:flavin reductase (DIM6/NTAB) family NADH-FMN oxidoreductase RutF
MDLCVVGLDEGVHQVVGPFRRDPVEEGDPAADSKAFRRCLSQFSTGVGVMTTVANGEPVGVTANSFSSLSMDPPLVLWSIAHNSRSAAAFKNAKHFAINILAVEQVKYSQRFARPAQSKFEDVDWRPGVLGSPFAQRISLAGVCTGDDASGRGPCHYDWPRKEVFTLRR